METEPKFIKYVKDGVFVTNFMVLSIFLFVLLGFTILFLNGMLDAREYTTAIHIGLGIIFGETVFKLLREKR